jgi:hypothetical protein
MAFCVKLRNIVNCKELNDYLDEVDTYIRSRSVGIVEGKVA